MEREFVGLKSLEAGTGISWRQILEGVGHNLELCQTPYRALDNWLSADHKCLGERSYLNKCHRVSYDLVTVSLSKSLPIQRKSNTSSRFMEQAMVQLLSTKVTSYVVLKGRG